MMITPCDFSNRNSYKNYILHTKSRLTFHVGVSVGKVVRVISCEDAGLNEAQQRVEFLQVVLDGRPRQQDSETN